MTSPGKKNGFTYWPLAWDQGPRKIKDRYPRRGDENQDPSTQNRSNETVLQPGLFSSESLLLITKAFCFSNRRPSWFQTKVSIRSRFPPAAARKLELAKRFDSSAKNAAGPTSNTIRDSSYLKTYAEIKIWVREAWDRTHQSSFSWYRFKTGSWMHKRLIYVAYFVLFGPRKYKLYKEKVIRTKDSADLWVASNTLNLNQWESEIQWIFT